MKLKETEHTTFHLAGSLPQRPSTPSAKPGPSQKPETIWISHMGDRDPGAWAIICSLPGTLAKSWMGSKRAGSGSKVLQHLWASQMATSSIALQHLSFCRSYTSKFSHHLTLCDYAQCQPSVLSLSIAGLWWTSRDPQNQVARKQKVKCSGERRTSCLK